MSMNIGNEAVSAVQELRNNPHFERLISALGVLTQNRVFGAIASPTETRMDATAYARGMYDLWEGLHAAHMGVQISQVRPPPIATVKRPATKEGAYAS